VRVYLKWEKLSANDLHQPISKSRNWLEHWKANEPFWDQRADFLVRARASSRERPNWPALKFFPALLAAKLSLIFT
jgi:hypothetical protein